MITVANTQQYSINHGSEVAYEIEYSDGTKVRAVQSRGGLIRKEYKKGEQWVQTKPYAGATNRRRAAEIIVATVVEALAA